MAVAGSRCDLRGRVPAPSRRHEHQRGHLKSVQPMAESVCRAPDRFNQAGMSRPCDRARRAAFAANVDPLRRLLSWGPNTSLPRQGLAHAPTRSGPGGRARRGVLRSRWTTPPVRATRSRAVLADILHFPARVVVTPVDAPIVREELSGVRE